MKTNPQEECAVSESENKFSRGRMGFNLAQEQRVLFLEPPIDGHNVYAQRASYSYYVKKRPVLTLGCKLLTIDASLKGWGAVLNGHPARGFWGGWGVGGLIFLGT